MNNEELLQKQYTEDFWMIQKILFFWEDSNEPRDKTKSFWKIIKLWNDLNPNIDNTKLNFFSIRV